MRARLGMGGLLVLVGIAGCETEPPECEVQEVPTCTSRLVVERPSDPAADFVIVLQSEAEGLDLRVVCPTPAGDEASEGDIIWFCGAGRLTLERPAEWPAALDVGFGGAFPTEIMPDYVSGRDFCGNLCNTGTILL